MSLDYITLVSIELKKHDPHTVAKNNLAQFNMKKYFHEDSPFDEVFKGVRSYNEVISRFQNLPDKEKSNIINFQKHKRSGFPKILQAKQILTHGRNPTSEVPP